MTDFRDENHEYADKAPDSIEIFRIRLARVRLSVVITALIALMLSALAVDAAMRFWLTDPVIQKKLEEASFRADFARKMRSVSLALAEETASAEAAKAATPTTVTAEPARVAPAEASVASSPADDHEQAKLLTMATVSQGQGVEHAFTSQLVAEPKKFNYQGEDKLKPVKKWAKKKAHRIALETGIVDSKTRREIRVKTPNKAAYVLRVDKDGAIDVDVYSKKPPQSNKVKGQQVKPASSFGDKPDYSLKAKSGFGKIMFAGANGVQHYEYVHAPG